MYRLFLNPIIVRLYDSDFVEISKPQQASLMDGREDALMDCGIDVRGSRMPYYSNWPRIGLF